MLQSKAIWEKASDYIYPEVGSKVWDRWFNEKIIVKTELHSDIFYICVTDSWAKSTLTMFFDIIEKALFAATQQNLRPMLVDLSSENVPTPAQHVMLPYATQTHFNPNYTFESYIVGDSNRFAHAAAMAVSESPSRSYNPLFIYGGSGLGKTHLMHAIAQDVLKKDPYKKVVYASTESFTNEFIQMLRENRLEQFKSHYRSTDVLLIDDIQFLANKKQIQEEFFYTFNALHDAGKQIVISSDRPPHEISPLEDRLRSRFGWGIIADIQTPDWETRCAILQSKAMNCEIPIHDDVVYMIADKINANIRELEGALNRLMYYSELKKADSIDMKIAQEALRDIFIRDEQVKLSIPLVQKVVADYFQLTINDLTSKRKDRNVSIPRQMAMYLCRSLIGETNERIGRDFGNRHHTTVMHACDTMAEKRKTDAELDRQLYDLERLILKK